jgi:hypothetical protein
MKRKTLAFSLLACLCISFVGLASWSHKKGSENSGKIVLVEKIPAISLLPTKRLDSILNSDGEYDIQVQTRMAVASERTIWLGFISTVIAVLIGAGSILLSFYQWRKNRKWEIGGLEIDFGEEPISVRNYNTGQRGFLASYKWIYSGKSTVRLISTRFELAPIDFMYLEKDWWKKINVHEEDKHKIFVEGTELSDFIKSDREWDQTEFERIISPVDRPIIKTAPLVLRGYAKYHTGAGETWIKPYIFRFEWKESGKIVVSTWSRFCKPVKKYPTIRTWFLEKAESESWFSNASLTLARILENKGFD